MSQLKLPPPSCEFLPGLIRFTVDHAMHVLYLLEALDRRTPKKHVLYFLEALDRRTSKKHVLYFLEALDRRTSKKHEECGMWDPHCGCLCKVVMIM